jgi:hypothetical protein
MNFNVVDGVLISLCVVVQVYYSLPVSVVVYNTVTTVGLMLLMDYCVWPIYQEFVSYYPYYIRSLTPARLSPEFASQNY